MRYATGHKDETRKHIIKVASQHFRQEGIEKVGVATLMDKAGLTAGGFYSHFKSKEDLIKEAVSSAADETLCMLLDAANKNKKNALQAILEIYLSPAHRDTPEKGCVIAALASELKNRPPKTKAILAERTQDFIKEIADRLPDQVSKTQRMRVAASIWALMVGTLQMSRLMTEKALSAQILKDGISNALQLATGHSPQN